MINENGQARRKAHGARDLPHMAQSPKSIEGCLSIERSAYRNRLDLIPLLLYSVVYCPLLRSVLSIREDA
jgi:hypothetical protein